MGQAFRKLFDTFFGNTEMRVPPYPSLSLLKVFPFFYLFILGL